MSYTNSYHPPSSPPLLSQGELYGPDPYDLNFVYPIHVASLETPRVKLVPFIPRVHADYLWSQVSTDLDLFRYFPFTWSTKEALLTYFEREVRQNINNVLFAVIDKTRPDPEHSEFEGGSFAGVIGLYNSVSHNLSSEIAFVAVLPSFQRTHVASNAVGALMKYCLELPNAGFSGLGLRRLEWKAHSKNAPSVRLAERMGFTREGMMRWHAILQPVLAKDGKKPREGEKWVDRYGRDTVFLSVCWDEWENGVKELAQKNVDRV
ncbi:acyl-CoA N-acyltransferase [Irpex rosettiformis]|uniref:Acyl-CoA N-acyltransferase n=1 Tax=Irpex rosettiformis TaxID=378272 RepID=A0ACB8TVK2_9APHY|nr:acyl-CoA N-acyltransferase [Irpex rosettiformis]